MHSKKTWKSYFVFNNIQVKENTKISEIGRIYLIVIEVELWL